MINREEIIDASGCAWLATRTGAESFGPRAWDVFRTGERSAHKPGVVRFYADSFAKAAEELGMHGTFPDFPAADLPPVPVGWQDNSWHNDTCPKYSPVDQSLSLDVYIDYIDPAKSERGEGQPRFSMQYWGDETNECIELFACDEWVFVTDFIDELNAGATVQRAALTIRQRSNTLSADDARALIAEDDAALAPDPDFEADMLRIIALHWAKEIGLGWHIDTRGADYSPALSAAQFATYDADMALLMRAANPYEMALEAMEDAGLISSEPDPCPIHRQPVTRCPDSCEYHA